MSYVKNKIHHYPSIIFQQVLIVSKCECSRLECYYNKYWCKYIMYVILECLKLYHHTNEVTLKYFNPIGKRTMNQIQPYRNTDYKLMIMI